ncbi:POK19 protein, partial [Pardalotus punctatus]|nr:POK19 protein [Pardalotus punctatus]
KHLLCAIAVLGKPAQIKIDNGPVYHSQVLKTFFTQWGIEHVTGIPCNSTGQAIIEHTHRM